MRGRIRASGSVALASARARLPASSSGPADRSRAVPELRVPDHAFVLAVLALEILEPADRTLGARPPLAGPLRAAVGPRRLRTARQEPRTLEPPLTLGHEHQAG